MPVLALPSVAKIQSRQVGIQTKPNLRFGSHEVNHFKLQLDYLGISSSYYFPLPS